MINKIETVDADGSVIQEVLSETSPHSIELSKTTKGYTWSIKLYFGNVDEDDPVGLLEEIDSQLKAKFDK